MLALYFLAFLSQLLLSRPVLAQLGPVPFALVQALVAWSWFCLHAKRLRDSGTEIGAAIAIAILYGLAVLLFMLIAILIAELMSKDPTVAPKVDLADWVVMFLFIGMLIREPNTGLFGYVATAVLLLILVPLILAVAFSVFAFGRPSAAPTLPPSQ